MIRLTIIRETLSDGSHVFNGDVASVFANATTTVHLPDKISFISENDARLFADGWLNLHLHRTNTPAEVVYAY